VDGAVDGGLALREAQWWVMRDPVAAMMRSDTGSAIMYVCRSNIPSLYAKVLLLSLSPGFLNVTIYNLAPIDAR
jgi:hypothetical protein